MNFPWDAIDKLGIIIGIIASIPIFWSWTILLGYRRRQRQIIKSLEKKSGDRPIAISIDLMPGESKNQVMLSLKTLGMDMEILKLTQERLNKDSLQDFVDGLHRLKADAMAKGTDRIHLFYRGPIVGALIVGEVFSNIAVTIYHFDKSTGTYESWGPLHRSFI